MPADVTAQEQNLSEFKCNICWKTAKEAVVNFCGHLFCWACLYRWAEMRPECKTCPMCEAACDTDKVVPLYNSSDSNQRDRNNNIPPRPVAPRIEPKPQENFRRFNINGLQFAYVFLAGPLGNMVVGIVTVLLMYVLGMWIIYYLIVFQII